MDGKYTFAGITVRVDQSAKKELNDFMEEVLARTEKILGL